MKVIYKVKSLNHNHNKKCVVCGKPACYQTIAKVGNVKSKAYKCERCTAGQMFNWSCTFQK